MEFPILITVMTVLVLLYIGTARYLHAFRHPERRPDEYSPTVSVLVAMRNEEASIGACLQSLQEQTYPPEAYRVLIMDDQSTDGSAGIARSFSAKHPHFTCISVQGERHGLKGKMNALAQGLEQADSELILITDADCIVPSGWIETFVSYFTEDTGLVAGLTLLYPPEGMHRPGRDFTAFQKIQALDWLFLQILAARTSHSGKPVTVLGNNFGFRKKAYERIGGFQNIGFSVTEDYALMRKIEKQTSWKIRHTLDPGNTIFSIPLDRLSAFYHQRKRWVAGGRTARLWGYYMMLLPTLLHLLLPVSVFTSGWVLVKALCWAGVIGTDYVILRGTLKRFKLQELRSWFILFEVFYFIYTTVFTIAAFLPGRIHWKERSY